MASRLSLRTSYLVTASVLCACSPAPAEPSGGTDAGASGWESLLASEQREAPARFDARRVAGGFALSGGPLYAARFEESGAIHVTSREELVLRTLRVGGVAAQAGDVSAHANVVELARPGVTEWLVNGPLGLEHGFVVSEPPASGELSIEIAVEGQLRARATRDGAGLTVAGLEAERSGFRYEGLRAFDASGRELPARMDVEPTRVTLRVAVEGARFPVVVDPTIAVSRAILEAGDADDELGAAVALDGDWLAVGAPYAAAADGDEEGVVHLFRRSGTSWLPAGHVEATADPTSTTDGHPGMLFGRAIDLEGSSLVVGASDFDSPAATESGAVYTFRRMPDDTWAHEFDLIGHSPSFSSWRFGRSVSISGDLLVVGEPNSREWATNAGAAYVYARTGMTWIESGSLSWSTATFGDSFGFSVAVDGARIFVGAPYDNIGGERAGSVFVYQRVGSTWTEVARLPADSAPEQLGWSISADGDRVAVGATRADDDPAAFTEGGGAVYIFERSGSTWSRAARIRPGTGDNPFASFGESVALDGDRLAVGASGIGPRGTVFVYRRASDGTWSEEVRITGRMRSSAFGEAVDLQGALVAVGDPDEDVGFVTDQGTGYVFELLEAATVELGDPCGAAEECISGFCVDGVCCMDECGFGDDQDCVACSVAEGAAVDGTCGARSAGSVCRAPVGACDAEEVCDGTALTCPSNLLATAGTVCRAPADACDAEEACDGVNPVCPMDRLRADGDACDDGLGCTGGETCMSGACVGTTLDCDDGDACTADACAEPAGCTHTPIDGCCAADADCDDGDACTMDACGGGTCAHTRIEGCGDAGATLEPDAGPAGPDAGVASSSDAGCGCAAPGGERPVGPLPLAALGALGLAARALSARKKRRRCLS